MKNRANKPGRIPRFSESQIKRLERLRKQGKSYKEISEIVEAPHSTVYDAIKPNKKRAGEHSEQAMTFDEVRAAMEANPMREYVHESNTATPARYNAKSDKFEFRCPSGRWIEDDFGACCKEATDWREVTE